jgi:hypothetical protein
VFPDGGLLKGAAPLPEASIVRMTGLFRVKAGTARFGEIVAVHAVSSPSAKTISVFSAKNDAYAITRAGCIEGGTKVVLEGHWRYAATIDTGLVRFFVGPPDLAKALCAGTDPATTKLPPEATLDGAVGVGSAIPDETVTLQRVGDLRKFERFFVAGHRGACRTIDDCGASENTRESIRMAESFGATVVENLFGNQDPIGAVIRVGRHPYRVIGVMARKGPSPGGAS